MSDSGASWWLGADRLWRKGHPPSGWHQTPDGLWHPPPTAATRLTTAETASAGAAATGATVSGSTATITPDGEAWQLAYDREPDPARAEVPLGARTGAGSHDELDPGVDVPPDADLDPEDGDDPNGYETAYYEQAGSFGRDTVHAAEGGTELDEEDRARHMAGGGQAEPWGNLVDRVLAWPIWLQLALPIAAMVILLGGIGFALADSGGGRPDRTAGDHDDVSDEFASGGPPTSSSSFLPSGSNGTGPSTSSTTTSPTDVSTTVTSVTAGGVPDDGSPDEQGGPAAPPPSSNPPSPSSTAPRPTSTTTPTTAPQDPYRFCSGLERLFPTDPDGDGTYCE